MTKLLFFFFGGVVLIGLSRPISNAFIRVPDPLKESREFAEVLDSKTEYTLRLLRGFRDEIRRSGPQIAMLRGEDEFSALFEKHGILIAVFRDDHPILWTSNAISPTSMKRTASLGTEIHHFDNGWYRLVYLTDGVDEYIGAILLQKTYAYDNAYLDNGFTQDFSRPGLESIVLRPASGDVKLKADHQFFYLAFTADKTQSRLGFPIYILLTIGGGILILFSLIGLARFLAGQVPTGLVLAGLATVIAFGRFWSLNAGWPGFVANHELFDPSIYASSALFPSLGDLIINTSLILVFAVLLRRLRLAHYRSEAPKSRQYLGPVLSIVALFSFGSWINYIVKGLIVDSAIPFDINNITAMNAFSFIGVAVAGVWYFTYYLLADTLAITMAKQRLNAGVLTVILLVLTALQIIVNDLIGLADMIMVLWPPILLFTAIYLRHHLSTPRFRLSHGTFVIILLGVIASHTFQKYSRAREHNERRILAQKIAQDDDPVAELLYAETRESLLRDAQVRALFEQNELHTRETFQDYILSRYFTGYWSKYDITMVPYLEDGTAWGKLSSVRPPSLREFREIVEKYGHDSSMAEGLFHIDNSGDRTSYIAIIPLHYGLAAQPDGYLVFEMRSKPFRHQIGFPALLMDRTTAKADNLANYSSARYLNGKLIDHRGEFSYLSVPGIFARFDEDRGFMAFRGYEHYVSKTTENSMVIISKPLISPLDKATTFSYLCVIFAAMFVVGMALRALSENNGRIPINLNQKIQVLLVALTLMTMVLFTVATRYYIEQKYTEKNERSLSEKLQSILFELKNKLGEEEQLDYDMADYINRLLSQFSYIFFTDINIYNPEGDLIASSQLRMFNEGLISRRIDPNAYVHVDLLQQVEFISNESIGRMDYLSAYAPFYNDRGDLLAYVNLPYFARQTELEDEISSFMVAVINLFVLVFLFTILFGLFISQWITSPLRAIRKSLSAIELGKSNRVVGYSARDEIGLLVTEYNAKVSELEHNAEKLAQSERESAWREMAKQVAHEIKNPLTPMKLSVQHMLRSVEQTGEVDRERLEKLTQNLIEQIDTLSSIANAFSNFARMPQARADKFDLVSTLRSTLALFQGFDRLDLRLDLEIDGPAMIMADKDQMARVFNNLIKNAIQSVPETRRGKVVVRVASSDGGYACTVIDNGSGIPEEVRGKMFYPSFTTKTRGMGLGLAITKNIVEQAGGHIDYTTETGKGSTFTVWLPAAD